MIDTRGRILGGHKTVEQAKHLGLPITVVPTTGQELVVVQRVDLDARTAPRAQELALADNRVAELDLDWDPAVLRQLEQAGVALEAFWTPEEFARLLAPEGPEAQPDEHTVLAPPTTTTIRRGDVFQLGRHRLACGDATSATDVARLLAGATPCLMVTDPHQSDGGSGLRHARVLWCGRCARGEGCGAADQDRVVVSTGRPIRCPRSDDQEGEGARTATVEEGVWLPSARARGECVLPVHVDRRRLSSGTQFIGATA